MTTRNFMIVLSLLIDASYAFNKCCPLGEVFTGTSKVNCASTPLNCSIELFFVNGSNSEFPICEKPEYITTTPLDQLNSMSFVQVLDATSKILSFSRFLTLSILRSFFFSSCIHRTRPVSKFFTNHQHLRTYRYSCIVTRTRTGTRRSNSFPPNPCRNCDS